MASEIESIKVQSVVTYSATEASDWSCDRHVIGKEEIEREEKMRHLGVVLDAKLTFDAREEGE